MTKGAEEAWNVITPETFVKASLCQLGKATATLGHWRHAVYFLFVVMMPRCCIREKTFKYFKDVAAKRAAPAPVVEGNKEKV